MDSKQVQIIIDKAKKNPGCKKFRRIMNQILVKRRHLKKCSLLPFANKTSPILEQYNIRIFTGYHYKKLIADMAIVQIDNESTKDQRLKERVGKVLAIIEVKYKNGGTTEPFKIDVEKIISYLKLSHSMIVNSIWHTLMKPYMNLIVRLLGCRMNRRNVQKED